MSDLFLSASLAKLRRMPIYEFHCDKCEKDSEILVRSSRWKGTKCPHCGSSKLSKRLSVFASSAGGGAQPAPVCGMKAPGSGGCHCTGGKHKH
jgi:putative FmdB family regulatory protein